MENKDLVKNTGLFLKTEDVKLQEILSQIEEVNIPSGTTFINEGEKADALYILKEGVVRVFTHGSMGEELILARLEKGSYFGEQALLNEIPGPRNASVRALTDTTLLKIKHDMFLKVISSDENLKAELKKIGFQQLTKKLQAIEIGEALKNVYTSPERGEITQHVGNFLHMPAMISIFKLQDGREIMSSRVVGKNIQYLGETAIQNPQKIIHEDQTSFRELHFQDDRLVGVTTYGPWDALKELYSRIFDKKGLSKEELKQFEKIGNLNLVEEVTPESPDDIICNCMYVPRNQIQDAICNGCTSVEEVSNMTGAGTVCGACIPIIQSMLGHKSWMAMHIVQVAQITPDSRVYRLFPVKKGALVKFKPGQHIVIQCQIDGKWVERSYTLTSTPDNEEYYEVAIKREEKGLFSRWLFEHSEVVAFIRTSRPQGTITVDIMKPSHIVCLTAGIGITPAICLARAISQMPNGRPLLIIHTARSPDLLAYDSELESLSKTNDKIKYIKHLTQEKGRLKPEDIIKIAQENKEADFFICGPKEFETMVKSALLQAGITENQITIEQFTHAGGPTLT